MSQIAEPVPVSSATLVLYDSADSVAICLVQSSTLLQGLRDNFR